MQLNKQHLDMSSLLARICQPVKLENEIGQNEQENDFDASVDVLYQSFLAWHRLQKNGVVKVKHLQSNGWGSGSFQLLHNGTKCRESSMIGKGKYSCVYQRGRFAYKIVRISHERDRDNLGKLRCNLKELVFFHSMTDPNVMKSIRSQLIMEHGYFHKIIHEMPSAKCTLQNMIYAHEIVCYKDLVDMFRGILSGLNYMHRSKIIHGDIKPSNILIMQDCKPVISDFTLTTFEGKGNEIAFGTLFWRAPECLLMQACSSASDVWSFGVMLLDCLYGCTYMSDIAEATDNSSMMEKLVYLIGEPCDEYRTKYKLAELKINPTFMDSIALQGHIQISLTDEELLTVQDLISKLLRWNAEERLTVDQIAEHAMFKENQEVKKPSPESVDSTSIKKLIWRDKTEREFVLRWVKYFYHELYQQNMPVCDDWLLHDTMILSKRLIDCLKKVESTYNVKNIIRLCCRFCYFLWKDIDHNNDPMFESQMFLVLELLKFEIFVPIVEEWAAAAAQAVILHPLK